MYPTQVLHVHADSSKSAISTQGIVDDCINMDY